MWLASNWPLAASKLSNAYAMGALALSLLGVWVGAIGALGLAFVLGISVLTWALS